MTQSDQIGNNYYRQVVGIPQGSVLSTLLCSFFYGDLERQFGSYTDSPDSVGVFYLAAELGSITTRHYSE